MRIVSNKPNILRLQDNISGSTLEIYFKTPTAKQHAAYTNGMTKRKRNRLVNTTGECRQKFGKEILAGFKDGDFGEEIDGKVVKVSSSQGSDDYMPEWKEWFCKHNADLVEVLARHAFENSSELDDEEEKEGDKKDDNKEDTDPNA